MIFCMVFCKLHLISNYGNIIILGQKFTTSLKLSWVELSWMSQLEWTWSTKTENRAITMKTEWKYVGNCVKMKMNWRIQLIISKKVFFFLGFPFRSLSMRIVWLVHIWLSTMFIVASFFSFYSFGPTGIFPPAVHALYEKNHSFFSVPLAGINCML